MGAMKICTQCNGSGRTADMVCPICEGSGAEPIISKGEYIGDWRGTEYDKRKVKDENN